MTQEEKDLLLKDLSARLPYHVKVKIWLEECIDWLEKQCYTKKDVDDAYLKGISDAKHELEKQNEQKTAVTDFNAKDWYVSKVDGKIHDMTYNPADKVEPNKKNNMKVFGCNAQLPYSGGGILVAANNLDEAFETAARKYDRLFDCLRQENGHIIPTSIDEAEVISSDLYPKYQQKEITELTCNCDKPHVIIENSYEE